ncbi:glycoside hydrolase family 43 protein [Annulohypoxylon maeteangense]|uniref:glycoside hydrolase family 43 protein n=1 Tax=Annulohypoxylon maeteangense TaxID=1927788 RepID=UPI0020086481|nr:glycoside hydrolase family 43 protein [Annulohypoxylon maeteangense]KAI0884137.1 glycoside hydrolase family 43 protein [Annulohypoxylon maeteangense]
MKKSFVLAAVAGLATALPSPDFGDIELFNVTEGEFEHGDIQARARGPWNGPVMDISFPDPTLLIEGKVWYAYATSGGSTGHIPLATSNDGNKWTWTKKDALPDVGSWIDPSNRGIWAPSVFKNDKGKYVMYFSGKRNGARRCVGVATADSPAGPFNVTDKPFICDDAGGGIIDPVQFDDGNNRWIIFKVDGNALGGKTTCTGGPKTGDYKPTPIRIQRVSRDGLTLQGNPKTILNHNGDADDGLIEGPAMWKRRPGSYVLFFSTHCYNSDKYDIQYAWATSPDGDFAHRKTLAKSGPNQPIYGPGHMDIASDGTTIAFHGRDKPGNPKDTKRRMYIGKIKFPEGDYSEGIKVINYQG